MDENTEGQFIWHELVTTDTTAAAAFYAKVARLSTQIAPSDSTYTMLIGSGQPMGGLLSSSTMGGSPRWLSFIVTKNADETARQTASLGGKVLTGPLDVPSGGRAAILEDPQGALFGVWSSDVPPQLPPEVPLGGISWHELATMDHALAFSFYQQLFGWHETSSMDMGPQGIYRMFAPAGSTVAFGGMYNKAPSAPGGPNWLPYIRVADARSATEVAKKHGAQILNGPMQVPGGGWIAVGIDPQGAVFALHSVAQATPAKKSADGAKRKTASTKRRATKKGTRKAARKTAAQKTAARQKAARKKTANRKAPKKTAKKKAAKKKAAKKKAAKKKVAKKRAAKTRAAKRRA
jgi:predicted enzyme related to lactoylglutathione lyase